MLSRISNIPSSKRYILLFIRLIFIKTKSNILYLKSLAVGGHEATGGTKHRVISGQTKHRVISGGTKHRVISGGTRHRVISAKTTNSLSSRPSKLKRNIS